jgi:hypothetical protein
MKHFSSEQIRFVLFVCAIVFGLALWRYLAF